MDSNGDPKRDDRGRLVCRIKKHDFEEFRSVVEKYGLRDDLSKLAQAGINDSDRPLLTEMTKGKSKSKGEGKKTGKSMQQTVAETEGKLCRICGYKKKKGNDDGGAHRIWVADDLCSNCETMAAKK